MSFGDLKFELSYNNTDNDIVKEFLIPALNESIEYDRAVGYFSSSALLSMSRGIKGLINNGGKIKLICSPNLNNDDIDAIKKGYEIREVVEKALSRDFVEPKNVFEEERFNILSFLIAEKIMDIKIAVMKSDNPSAIFHDKVGVLYDDKGNYIAFTGSMNESNNAYYQNSESIDVYSSIGSDYQRAINKKSYFDRLWNNEENRMEIFDFPESIICRIDKYRKAEIDFDIDAAEQRSKERDKNQNQPTVPDYLVIRDYQNDAYQAWKRNEFRGIYDMATGTGKTYTALYSIVNLYHEMNEHLSIVICCPYQHLVNQWMEDLEVFGFKYISGFSQSIQKNWKKDLEKAIFNYNHGIENYICFITTNATFSTSFVQESLKKIQGNLLIVIDEAHNFGTARLSSLLDDKFSYRLALSATLERHNDLVGTQKLLDFFGEKCIEYTLEMAIEAGMLSRYKYYPIPVYLDEDELEQYNVYSEELRKYIRIKKDGSIEYSKKAEMILIKRSRLIAGAKNKLTKLSEIIKQFKNSNHLLVYCGSTTVVDNDYIENKATEEEIRQVDAVTDILEKNGITAAKFTSQENAKERELLKKEFSDGSVIQALVAIRCLDEGVNIPSIDKAIILASSTNPKEYIQRRGRVLRIQEGKKYAVIYDFVTLPRDLDSITPTTDFEYDLSLIKRELSRVKDFASAALNEYESDQLISNIENIYGYIEEGEYDDV